jgi:hypothetical protein
MIMGHHPFTRKNQYPLRVLAREKLKNPQHKIILLERFTGETLEEKKKANLKG